MGDRVRYMLRAVGPTEESGAHSSGIAVGATGVSIGRDPQRCRIVIPDTPDNCMVGRMQAFVMPHMGRLHLVNMGRNPTYVNGEAIHGAADLDDGSVLQFEESPVAITVAVSEAASAPRARTVSWRLDGKEGQTYRIVETPFEVGGGPRDHLHVEDWPAAALRFHLAQNALYLEVGEAVHCNGEPISPGEPRPMSHGDELEHGGRSFLVMALAAGGPATTVVKPRETLPVSVELRFLPRGANLVVSFVDSDANAVLTDKQAALAGALLAPRFGAAAGEFVDDEELLERVWPRDLDKTQKTLNLLVHQLRTKLLQSDLDANVLIAKPPGAGATRFSLAEGAKVRVIST